jgi:hypothetical protein
MQPIGLSMSLLGGEIKAVSTSRGRAGVQWAGRVLEDEFEGFAEAVREAGARTQAVGRQVAVVLAHSRMSDQPVAVPPVNGRMLDKLLERQAQSVKAFQGEVVWSRQAAVPTKQSERVLLHLCPKRVVDLLIDGCQDAGFQLVRVLPSTAVLAGQLKELPVGKDELVLVAAETGSSTTIVIGQKNGKVCVSRVLPESWGSAPDRVWLDLIRSVKSAEQQSGMTVSSGWLLGSGAEPHIPAVQELLKIPVKLSPTVYTPYFWAEQAARLPEKDDGNLISPEVRQAPQRQRMMTLTGLLLSLLVLIALGTAVGTELLRRSEVVQLQEISTRTSELRAEQRDLQNAFDELEEMKEMLRVTMDDKLPPVPGWFLGYLGQVVPDNLVLTRMQMARTNEMWLVKMAGVVRRANTTSTPPVSALNSLSNNLSTGAFNMRITRAMIGAEPEIAQARAQAPRAARPDSDSFVIEGMMR